MREARGPLPSLGSLSLSHRPRLHSLAPAHTPPQTEEQKQRKLKKVKALKLQHRQKASEELAQAAAAKWLAFQSLGRR